MGHDEPCRHESLLALVGVAACGVTAVHRAQRGRGRSPSGSTIGKSLQHGKSIMQTGNGGNGRPAGGAIPLADDSLEKINPKGDVVDAVDVLKDAWSAVEKADLPREIQPIAFREAVRLLASPTASAEPTGRAGPTGRPSSGVRADAAGEPNDGAGGGAVSEDEIYDRVARSTGADRNKLEQVVHLDDDGPRVSLPGIKLGSNNADRTRAVAQIITVTRGFGLDETETPLELIRAECNRLKVYDSANFSTQISKLNGYVVSGSGQNRRLRAKSPGIQNFPALVDSLLGES